MLWNNEIISGTDTPQSTSEFLPYGADTIEPNLHILEQNSIQSVAQRDEDSSLVGETTGLLSTHFDSIVA